MGKGNWAIGAAAVTLLLVSLELGFFIAQSAWQRECIRRGVAQYNPQSGAWEWTVERKAEADSK